MPFVFENEEKLLSACLRREPGAWEAFINLFSKLIYWSIRQTLQESNFRGRDDLIADIFQDVFSKIFEKSETLRLDDAKSIRKFLVVLAANSTRDRIRSLSRLEKKSVFIDADTENSDITLPPENANVISQLDPAESVIRGEKRQIISEVLDGLSARERACLEMNIFDGRTHKELSLILGIPQDTVSSMIRRAKDKIRDLFLKKGISG